MIPGVTAQSLIALVVSDATIGAATGSGTASASGVGVGTIAVIGSAAGIGAGAATGFAAIVAATFDGTATNVTLSNGNLTATHSNTTSNSGARSTSTKTTGKYYFEITATATHGVFDCVGALVSTGTYTDMVTNATNCLACYKNTGNIYANNVNSTLSVGSILTGDILSLAIDLTARKAWVRKNAGSWNNVGHDPAAGTGGATLAPTVAFAPAVGFGGSSTAAGDAFTGNFGQSAFTYTAPSGFGNWTA